MARRGWRGVREGGQVEAVEWRRGLARDAWGGAGSWRLLVGDENLRRRRNHDEGAAALWF